MAEPSRKSEGGERGGEGHLVWLYSPARVGFGPSIPLSNRLRRMSWQTIQDFLTGNANLIALIAGLVVFAGVLVARGLWMYRRVSGRDKLAPRADARATVERRADGARQDKTRSRGGPGPSA